MGGWTVDAGRQVLGICASPGHQALQICASVIFFRAAADSASSEFWRPGPKFRRQGPFCPPFACLQCKGWAIAMTLSVCLSVCPHKTRNCEETERRTKKVLEIKVVGYDDSYSGVPSVVTSDDI
jgi:hypothetical protein